MASTTGPRMGGSSLGSSSAALATATGCWKSVRSQRSTLTATRSPTRPALAALRSIGVCIASLCEQGTSGIATDPAEHVCTA